MIERERKWLLTAPPVDLPAGTSIRQGYLATEAEVATRIRQKGDAFVGTIKAGETPARVEVEWSLTAEEFEALWPFTVGRQVSKVRHEIPIEGDGQTFTAELDVFDGDLTGLVMVEVEFDSNEALEGFVAPDWFGPDVTHHGGYGNGTLAVAGLPPDHAELLAG